MPTLIWNNQKNYKASPTSKQKKGTPTDESQESSRALSLPLPFPTFHPLSPSPSSFILNWWTKPCW